MARTRVTGRALDLDQLFADLRHFDLEQLDEHLRAGAAGEQLRAPVFLVDAQQIRTQAVVLAHALAGDHVLAGDQRLGVGPQVEHDGIAAGLLDHAADQLADAVAVLFDDLTPLRFAHLLHDHLFRRLRRDATEAFRRHLFFIGVADLQLLVVLVGFVQRQLTAEFIELFIGHHVPDAEGARVAADAVDLDTNLHIFFLEALFGRRRQGRFNGLEDHVAADAFLVGNCFRYQQDFFVHGQAFTKFSRARSIKARL